MSDMHILTANGSTVRLIGHAAVPATPLNDSGVSFRDALVNAGQAATALPEGDGTEGTIGATEKGQVEAGYVFEFGFDVELQSGGVTDAERKATARATYTKAKADLFAEKQRELQYFGLTLEETP